MIRVLRESAGEYVGGILESYAHAENDPDVDMAAVAFNVIPQPTFVGARRLAGQGKPIEAALVLRQIPTGPNEKPSDRLEIIGNGWEMRFRRIFFRALRNPMQLNYNDASDAANSLLELARITAQHTATVVKEAREQTLRRSGAIINDRR